MFRQPRDRARRKTGMGSTNVDAIAPFVIRRQCREALSGAHREPLFPAILHDPLML